MRWILQALFVIAATVAAFLLTSVAVTRWGFTGWVLATVIMAATHKLRMRECVGVASEAAIHPDTPPGVAALMRQEHQAGAAFFTECHPVAIVGLAVVETGFYLVFHLLIGPLGGAGGIAGMTLASIINSRRVGKSMRLP